mmetsp:Transcript_4326/g.6415  ORF Transcript_4326/g.6415 Transcript_4326/m.6415 type:complete len:309 (+) Transcript_4326:86-1012(+)
MEVKSASGHSAPRGGLSRRRTTSADRRNRFITSFNVVALYLVALVYAYRNGPSGKKDGLEFDDDPVKTFMVSPPVVYGLPLVYLICVWSASRVMASRPAATNFLRTYIQPVYNVAQIVICSYMAWGLSPQVNWKTGNIFGLNMRRNASIEWFVYLHYLTKYMDWCDTFFMILKKNFQQVSFLQVFHHATIGMVWGFLLSRGWGSGTASYGAFINSVTHVLMYTHYFFASFGFKNPFKKHLTSFQIAQFASCIIHAVLVLVYDTVYPVEFAYLQVAYQAIMIYLFGWCLNWAPLWCTGPAPEPKPEKLE